MAAASLDMKEVEKDAEELDEEYFSLLTKSMVTHNVKKQVFFESFTDDDTTSDHSTPEKKKLKRDEYDANISASATFTELEQERRCLFTELERVRWSVMIVR